MALHAGRQSVTDPIYVDVGRHTLVCGLDQEIVKFVSDIIPFASTEGLHNDAKAIGVLTQSGKLIAGMVYHDYQPAYGTMQISMGAIAPTWGRRETIRGLLDYPFNQLGVYKIWVAVPHINEHTIKSSKHLGFKQEAILAHQFGRGVHAWMGRILKPDFQRLYESD